MQMETRSWRGNDPVEPMTPNPYSTRNQAPGRPAARPGARAFKGASNGRSGPGGPAGAPRSGNRSAASRVNRGTRGR